MEVLTSELEGCGHSLGIPCSYEPLRPNFGASQVAEWQRIHLPSRKLRFNPWFGKIPWIRRWQPTPVSFPGKSHEQRSLTVYSL